jgi:hypothetical protein
MARLRAVGADSRKQLKKIIEVKIAQKDSNISRNAGNLTTQPVSLEVKRDDVTMAK